MKRTLVAVDPGSVSGAWAWGGLLNSNNVVAWNMPQTLQAIYNFLRTGFGTSPLTRVIMEDVGGSMPGNAAKAARTFAAHVGALEMAFVALGYTVTRVRPQIWMGELLPEHPKAERGSTDKEKQEAKKLRKQYIYDQMRERFPGSCFTKSQADAVALYAWGLMKGLNNG